MSEIPPPEPTEKDAELADAFERMRADVKLRGVPEGDDRCDNCHFYVEPKDGVSYCWHEKVDALVGKQWWCDRWEAIGASDEVLTPELRQKAMQLKFQVVEDQQWVAEPKFGEKCEDCLFYAAPGESVSYCWHPNIRCGVGQDHWCQWWEPAEGKEVSPVFDR